MLRQQFTRLLVQGSASSLALAGFSFGLAVAETDDGAEEDTRTLNRVVVTSQKREEGIDSIAAAVSAFTKEDRSIAGIITTQDIANFTPGLSISDSPNRVNIRGVGRVTNELGSDPGVANYVDGFYTSESDVIGGSDFLVERVEVLRGPQGTLYGRNSIGGAVNVISRRPAEKFEAEMRLGYNNYEVIRGGVSLSGPVTDQLRYRFAATGVDQGKGYVENLTGADQWTDNSRYVEGQLEMDLTDRFSVWLKASSSAYNRRNRPYAVIDPADSQTYHTGLVANSKYQYPTSANPSISDPYTVDYDFDGRERLDDNFNFVAHAEYNFDGFDLKYIGGYSQYAYFRDRDFDGTSRTGYSVPAFGTTFPVSTNYVETVEENKKWWSHEINLISSGSGPFGWILGGYYYNEELDQPYWLSVPDVSLFENPVELGVPEIINPKRAYYYQNGELESKAHAIFARGSWAIGSDWTVAGGLRYTEDKKRGGESQFQVFYNVAVDPGNTYGIVNATRNFQDSWNGVSGDVDISYTPREGTLLYAKAGRGYKSGGFKLGGLLDDADVNKETLTALELGWKQSFGSNLQVNSAIFHYDYSDLQVLVAREVAPGIIQSSFTNAPETRSQGVEVEAVYAPTDSLRLTAVYAHLNARFTEFSNVIDAFDPSQTPQDLSGNRMPQAPRNKLTLNGAYDIGPLTLSATQTWVDEQYYGVFNTPSYRAGSYSNTNVRATWNDPRERFRFIVGVRNLFDETSFSNVGPAQSGAGSVRVVTPNLPQIVEAEPCFPQTLKEYPVTKRKTAARTQTPAAKALDTNTSKSDQLKALLSDPTGATVTTLSDRLGWQTHTTRAALTRLKQAGIEVEKLSAEDGTRQSRYRLAGAKK